MKLLPDNIKNKIYDITVGVFRMGQDYFQRVRKSRPESIEYYKNYVSIKNKLLNKGFTVFTFFNECKNIKKEAKNYGCNFYLEDMKVKSI